MNFEELLKIRIQKEVIENLENFENPFNERNEVSDTTNNVLQRFIDIIDTYNFKRYEKQKTDDEIFKMGDDFKELLTEKNLFEMYKRIQLTEEDKLYIKYVELSKQWRGHSGFFINKKYAIVDILLRTLIIEQFDEDSLEELKKIMEKEKNPKMKETCKHYLQLLSEDSYEDLLHRKFEKEVSTLVNILFNDTINCGGYSLKIDTTVYPYYYKDFSKCVSAILYKFPFVKLLGEEKLKDDEYLVLYRSNKENTGHHFVRVDDDGRVTEKEGKEEPQIFAGWRNLESCQEAIFAVKKEHTMFGYDNFDVNDKNINAFNFEESIINAINNKNNSFEYHGHEYVLKKYSDIEILVVSNKMIVANVITDGEEYLIETVEEKNDYIENFSGSIKPIIEDGYLLNRNEFVEQKEYCDYEGR